VTELGTLRQEGERRGVRFERLYDATPEELWAALTDPEQIRGWLADATRWELAAGEEYELMFGDDGRTWGRILAVEPPRVLELEWTYADEPASVVRFEIVPREAGCLLVLDHSRLDPDSAPGYGAGWHAHLDALDALLAGRPAGDGDEWWARYRELRPRYEAATLS